MNKSSETKWKKNAFRKKRSQLVSDDFHVQVMNNKINNVKERANYKNIPALNNVYEMPYVYLKEPIGSTIEGFLDDPSNNSNKLTSIEQCLKNGDPSMCDYEGIFYPDKSTGTPLNQKLIEGLNNLFQSYESMNMKIAKYTYTAYSGAKNIIRHGYDSKMNKFLTFISYYNIELATEDVSFANPKNSIMIKEFNERKDKSEEYDTFVWRRLEDDIKKAEDNKSKGKSFAIKYIPPDYMNCPEETLNLAKYIHDVLLIKDYIGIFEAEILCVWCLYNLYFLIYKGKDMPELSRMKLFQLALENYYLYMMEFLFSTTLAFPEILNNIKRKIKELVEYRDAVLPDNFKIMKNIISNKGSIMLLLFCFLLLFLATIGKFLKNFFLTLLKGGILGVMTMASISVGLCFLFAFMSYCFYMKDLLSDGEAGRLKVFGYFGKNIEFFMKFSFVGIIFYILFLLFHFIINMIIAVPLGMIVTTIYFLFCIFSSILYLADLSAFARIDKEIDIDLESEIKRAKDKSAVDGSSIWTSIYYAVLQIIKFLYNLKHSIALIIICSVILNDIQLHATNKVVCNYIFVPILVIAIMIFCYMVGMVYSKKAEDILKGVISPTADKSSGISDTATPSSDAKSSSGTAYSPVAVPGVVSPDTSPLADPLASFGNANPVDKRVPSLDFKNFLKK